MMQELFTDLPRVLPWASVVGVVAMVLPRLLREIPEIIRVLTMRRLCKALTDKKDGWSDETERQVLRAIVELGQHPPADGAADEGPGAPDPPAAGQSDRP